ncbi:MAG: Tex family protein [Bacteroidia bacterium]|nr:Tex family protein [Bacteroidia bacterium]
MNITYTDRIARETGLSARQVSATLSLIGEGATIPFMARYRKEVTGSLDELQLTTIRDRAEQLEQLDKRRAAILDSLTERNLLTDELRAAVEGADTLSHLEDIYLPYRPKRRTRAMIAREKGLEPLALLLLAQDSDTDPDTAAGAFVNSEKEVASVTEALQGARDIIAEKASEDADVRARMRDLFMRGGIISSRLIKGKEEEGVKFKDYFDWSESLKDIPSHRLLALRRGEKEGFLSLTIRPDEAEASYLLEKQFIQNDSAAAAQVREALEDAYDRLLAPSMETEVRLLTKDKADGEAIRVFADNLRQLLLAPALGQKTVMALDPGFRTGCKTVCLSRQGQLLDNTTIYPHSGKQALAAVTVLELVKQYEIEVIAVGNGTAGRETEAFLKEIGLPAHIPIVMVNESGASIYSASEVAREEFPDHDLTVRGAVSIGRRLMDPLAELVKLDPKSIGVGQYQHDVDQNSLKKSLDDIVISCVNAVGVEVNTASKQLLTYVSGFGPSLAQNVVEYRNQHGPFRSREDLRKVPRLGAKAFEQAAGFLRIHQAPNPLDASAVHPESYPIVAQMAADLGVTVGQLMQEESLRKKIDLKRYITDKVGLPTLQDILLELAKPGRDPREKFETFSFADGVNSMEDLREGMTMPGIVTNVTDFGAFVDIGVHQDGLVHLSQMANRFIKHPAEVVKVQQQVMVRVVSVDIPRKRISLSMKLEDQPRTTPRQERETHKPVSGGNTSDFIRIKPGQRKK